ncbi:MAG: PTH1 family peptidyl-tRNA hydrolase [Saprospiraceae bacterium]|jgi:PTH1 family peptidyl-tRNA hydrolase
MLEWLRQLFAFNKEEETEDPMKYLVVGLGNIGGEYDNTRHNIGFDVVDYLADQHEGKWKTDTLGDVCEIKHKGRTIVLLKPSTYMNRSGKAVNYWMTKKKIQKDNLLVIVDDLHINLGKIRLRGKGSDGGHNGLKDIQQILGGSNYPRLKFGIGNDFHSGQQVDFVLGKWTSEEKDKLQKVIKKAADATKSFATIGIKFTMEQFNG